MACWTLFYVEAGLCPGRGGPRHQYECHMGRSPDWTGRGDQTELGRVLCSKHQADIWVWNDTVMMLQDDEMQEYEVMR